jgi:Ni/Co efflux regulator RcnB
MLKRLMLTLVAVASVAGPMAMSAAPAQAARWDNNDRGGRGDHRRGDRDGRWDNDRRGNGRWDNDNRRGNERWDERRYNGYYYNNRWVYGPPPEAYWGNPGFRPGYNAWRRGSYLPPYYRGYVVNDYYSYRLRPPPRGYHWVRVNNEYLLVAIATGLIFDIIANGY